MTIGERYGLGGTHMLPSQTLQAAYDPALAQKQATGDFQNYLNNALQASPYGHEVLPQYDYSSQAQDVNNQTQALLQQSALNASANQQAFLEAQLKAQQQGIQNLVNQQFSQAPVAGAAGATGAATGSPNARLGAVLRALGAQESGNSYSAVNKDSGAMGRWQVMPSNISGTGGWDKEALGRDISTQEYMSNPQLQNQIVRYQFGKLLSKYGVKGALSAWYSGDPNAWNNRDPQGNYPSIHEYVMEVLQRLGQ